MFDSEAILEVFSTVTTKKPQKTPPAIVEKTLINQQGNQGNRKVTATVTEKTFINQQGNRGNQGNRKKQLLRVTTHREDDRQKGINIINQLAADLPITDDELMTFYADELQYIGSGEITPDTVKYSLTKLVEGRPPAEVDERVRCTECTQYRCRRKGRQYSPVLRWCNQYHAK